MATFLLLLMVLTMVQVVHMNSDKVQHSIHITYNSFGRLGKYAFAEIPTTYDEAVKAGYKEMPKNANYKGARFIRDNDASNILIFSENKPKRFVGFQVQIPVSGIKKKTKWMKWFDVQPMFSVENRDGEKFYVATFYVIDPDTIDTDKPMNCGRLICEVYFQNGPTATTVMKAPMKKAQIREPWVEGVCIPLMGNHYWLNMKKDADCMDLAPFFILQINNKLSGVGLHILADVRSSPRFEHLPFVPIPFFKDWAECLKQVNSDVGGLTSLHIYFNENPDKYLCT